MVKAIKVMLIPNNVQKTKMFQYAGAARFAYNWALAREKENYEKVDEEEKALIREKYNSEIDWSSFEDGSFKYNVEYDEDSQSVWVESATGNEYEMYATYDLKYETLTIYNMEFSKTSE